jgi:hypothetical protein
LSLPKHIKSLERAGLVTRHCEGRIHRLALQTAPLAEAEAFIGPYQARSERELDRLENYMKQLSNGRSKDGNQKGTLEERLIRRVPHPISFVYEIWTMPEHLERWLSPADDIEMKVIQFHLREGAETTFTD